MNYRIILSFLVLISLVTSFIPSTQVSEVPATTELRVMNYNTHFGVELNVGYSVQGFADVVKDINPQVVGFEEITTSAPVNGFADMYGDFVQSLGKMGYHYSYVVQGEHSPLRNAIFSKIEFQSVQTVFYSQRESYFRSFIDAELVFNGVTYHILVTHLTHLPSPDTSEPSNISTAASNDVRKSQMTELVNYAKKLGNNVIVLGDFNFWPAGDEYTIATSFFKDSWVVTNPGNPGYTYPSVHNDNPQEFQRRIDYVFVSQNLTPTSCSVKNVSVSDHRPISCNIQT